MIITEIKHLNVRISEFEDPIFDKNILPVFTTPLILKEVEARKKSKYKIETLNPEKKLTFKIVSFTKIVEELAARINKIAIDLEPHYFIDPSHPNSLPYKVRQILDKNNLINETKEIEEAILRIKKSTVRGKKLILYARPSWIWTFFRRTTGSSRNYLLINNKSTATGGLRTVLPDNQQIWIRARNHWKYSRKWNSITGWSPLLNKKYLNMNKAVPSHLAVPRQKAKVSVIATSNKTKPGRRRLNINYKKLDLFLAKILKAEVILRKYNKDRVRHNQAWKAALLTDYAGVKAQAIELPNAKSQVRQLEGNQNQASIDLTETLPKLQLSRSSKWHVDSTHPEAIRLKNKNKLAGKSYLKTNKEKTLMEVRADKVSDSPGFATDNLASPNVGKSISADRKYSGRKLGEKNLILSGILPTSKGALMLLDDEGWDLDLLLNKNSISQRLKKRRPYRLRKLRRLRRLRRLRLMSINLYLHRSKNVEKIQKDQVWQGRNHSKLINCMLTAQGVSVNTTAALQTPSIVGMVKAKDLAKNSLVLVRSTARVNDNKLNYIVNLIGDNLSYTNPDRKRAEQRLNKKNISDIFLVHARRDNQPIELPSLEMCTGPAWDIIPVNLTENSEAAYGTLVNADIDAALHQVPYNNGNNIPAANTSLPTPVNATAIQEKYSQNTALRSQSIHRQPALLPGQVAAGLFSKNSKLTSNTGYIKTAKAKNRKFSTLTLSGSYTTKQRVTTKTSIANPDHVALKILSQYRAASNTAPYSNKPKRSNKELPLTRPEALVMNLPLPFYNPIKGQSEPPHWKKSNKLLPFTDTNPTAQNNPQKLSSSLAASLRLTLSRAQKRKLRKKKFKVMNWKKKIGKSAKLLKKTSLNYVNSLLLRRKQLLIEEFKANNKHAGIHLPRLARALQYQNLNKIKKLAEPNPWKKIDTLLNTSTPKLFWSIIKLYSSSFNPMLKSLNKKKLAITGLMGGLSGTSSAQIKRLKSKSNLPDSITANGGTANTENPENNTQQETRPVLQPIWLARYFKLKNRPSPLTPQVKRLKALKYATNILDVKLSQSGQNINEFISKLPAPSQNVTVKLQATKSIPDQPNNGRTKAQDKDKNRVVQAQIELITRAWTTLTKAEKEERQYSQHRRQSHMADVAMVKKKELVANKLVSGILPIQTGQSRLDAQKSKKIPRIKSTQKINNKPRVRIASQKAIKKFLPFKFNLFNFQKNINKILKPVFTSAAKQFDKGSATAIEAQRKASRVTLITRRKAYRLYGSLRSASIRRRKYKVKKTAYEKSILKSIKRADKTKFLFLYFIVPIFFATLKNSTAFGWELNSKSKAVALTQKPASELPAVSYSLAQGPGQKDRLNNLNKLKKQLESLIKLMFPYSPLTGSIRRSRKLSGHSALARGALDLLTYQRSASSATLAKKSFLSKDINNLMESLDLNLIKKKKTHQNSKSKSESKSRRGSLINKFKVESNLGFGVTATPTTRVVQHSAFVGQQEQNKLAAHSFVPMGDNTPALVTKSATATQEILKLTLYLIAQSLSPLKRKQNFYNLMFIKILETSGFLALENKTNVSLKKETTILKETEEDPNDYTILDKSIHPFGEQHSQTSQVSQAGLHKTGLIKPGAQSSTVKAESSFFSKTDIVSAFSTAHLKAENAEPEAVKKSAITFYSGGRFLSDWKRVTKVIWQENYKFKAAYWRMNNYLKINNKNLKIKLRNWYLILKILRLIEINIKNSKNRIKTVSALKLKYLFLERLKKKKHPLMRSLVSDFIISTPLLSYTDLPLILDRTIQANWISQTGSLGWLKIIEVWRKRSQRLVRTRLNTDRLDDNIRASQNSQRCHSLNQSNLFNVPYRAKDRENTLKVNNLSEILDPFIKTFFQFLKTNWKIMPVPLTQTEAVFYNTLKVSFKNGNSSILNLMDRLGKDKGKTPFRYIKFLEWIKLKLIIRLQNLHFLPYRYGTALISNFVNNHINKINYFIPFTLRSTNQEVKSALLTEGIQSISDKAGSLKLNTDFKKRFNNLVNAKSTIIGKIRSIKLVELIDKLKEEVIIAERLAALVRVADITILNFSNKKKFRRINASKYLNKKNINRSNRIKILQTIEIIKTDFRFEPLLDSNSLSNNPVSLLYYSNLKTRKAGAVEPGLLTNNSAYGVAGPGKAIMDDKVALGGAYLKDQRDQKKRVNLDLVQEQSPFRSVERHPVISAYLRELSIYNRETKGIINYFSKIVGYNFNTNTNKISSTVNDLLEASFKAMRCLISKPVYIITPDKIKIQLFYFLLLPDKKQLRKIRKRYWRNIKTRIIYKRSILRKAKKLNLFSLNQVYPKQFELLCGRLNKVFNKPVELNLIRLHYPSEDTNILVNLMGIIVNKVKLFRIFRKLFAGSIIKTLTNLKKRKYNDITIIPAFLTGLNIRVAGRIMTQKIKPRKTINLIRRGATASGKVNYLNIARLTNKNKRGSYSITITAGQNYFK